MHPCCSDLNSSTSMSNSWYVQHQKCDLIPRMHLLLVYASWLAGFFKANACCMHFKLINFFHAISFAVL